MGIRRRLPEVANSGLTWVIASFGLLIAINLVTLAAGTSEVLSALNANPAGAVLSPFVFDSWGTIGGLAGIVVLFAPLLFGTPVAQRKGLSVFFLSSSVAVGVASALLWDRFYDTTGLFGSGSSSIAIAGQGVLFALSIVGLVRLARQDTRRLGDLSSHWWYSFAIIYLTLILTSLWFILVIEPIFIPTDLYNWRVHEFGFLLGAAIAAVYSAARWSPLGLDGVVRIDEMLMNFHFDDLCARFDRRLPKYHVVFGEVSVGRGAAFHPELGEIWVTGEFKGADYAVGAVKFDSALLGAMVSAELLAEGVVWDDGATATLGRYNELARKVGASEI